MKNAITGDRGYHCFGVFQCDRATFLKMCLIQIVDFAFFVYLLKIHTGPKEETASPVSRRVGAGGNILRILPNAIFHFACSYLAMCVNKKMPSDMILFLN